MIPQLPTPFTHPETARFAVAVPLLLGLVAVLTAALLLRHLLQPAYQNVLVRYTSRNRIKAVDPALVFVPELLSTEQFLLASGAALLVVWLPLWLIMPMLLALLLSPIALVIVIWLVLKFAEQRYVSNLDSALASTVARMSALLANGSGFQPVLRRIVDDLPAGPLRQEWSFIVERLGMPVGEGGLATPQMVVNALRFQTPSHRHSALLEHLSVALGQTHDILVARMQAAAQSLHDADRRRSAAVTELAQMRYSGFAVGLAGMFMAVYLFTSQQERFWTAYKGTLGMIAGTIVLSALVAPLIGGVLLSRSDDLDY